MFIEVTDRDGKKILVNLNYITEIKVSNWEKGTDTILFHLKGMYEVKETYEEIRKMIVDKEQI